MWDWIRDNKAWLFDGLFVGLLAAITGVVGAIFRKRNKRNADSKVTTQKQWSGKNSINLQAIGDIRISKEDQTINRISGIDQEEKKDDRNADK